MKLRLIIIAFLSLPYGAYAEGPGQIVPRKIIALYDSRDQAQIRNTQLSRFLEMPANYLGLNFVYYDVNAPMPAVDDNVRGVVLWFDPGTAAPNPEALLAFLHRALDQHKKIAIIENMGLGEKETANPQLMQEVSKLLSRLGVQRENIWRNITYQAKVLSQNNAMVAFERSLPKVIPDFNETRAVGDAVSHLRILGAPDAEAPADLVITSDNGGYVEQNFALFNEDTDEAHKPRLWFINPFEFLRFAFQTDDLPKPDTTTLAGRRIFYSHIDGDGWNNVSEISRYNKRQALSAEVVLKEIFEQYPDFAFHVGVITCEIDESCYGVPDSAKIARAMYALPNVFPGNHTHSHPLFWRFFSGYTPDKERALLDRYPRKPRLATNIYQQITESKTKGWDAAAQAEPKDVALLPAEKIGRYEVGDATDKVGGYDIPRSYAAAPFDLQQEIIGSTAIINQLTPPGKKVDLLQWSGDTSPFEAAIQKSREAGLYNINGGDSRFDSEYPSYASVAPIGVMVGNERQIYSSNSNENTYTNLWTGRFFGFRYLQNTVYNTETPLRIKPFNLYFHIYSGEKEASLGAVKENLDYARKQALIPITAAKYAAIANGYYAVTIKKLAENRWKITNNGTLSTIRFDHSSLKSVDFEQSQGVMGQRYGQGSLYVALDPAAENIIIQLKNNNKFGSYPTASTPYLIESRWQIKRLQSINDVLTNTAEGFGHGMMSWKMPLTGKYRVEAMRGEKHLSTFISSTDQNGILRLDFGALNAVTPVDIRITPVD